MKKILLAVLITTMMLMALGTAADVTKSTTNVTITTPETYTTNSTTTTTGMNPGTEATNSTTTTTSVTPASEPTNTTKSTTTTTSTPGFEATFAVAGLLGVTFLALRRRH